MIVLSLLLSAAHRQLVEMIPQVTLQSITSLEEAKRKLSTYPDRVKFIDGSNRQFVKAIKQGRFNLNRAIFLDDTIKDSCTLTHPSPLLLQLAINLLSKSEEDQISTVHQLAALLQHPQIEQLDPIHTLFNHLNLPQCAQVTKRFQDTDQEMVYRMLIQTLNPPPVIPLLPHTLIQPSSPSLQAISAPTTEQPSNHPASSPPQSSSTMAPPADSPKATSSSSQPTIAAEPPIKRVPPDQLETSTEASPSDANMQMLPQMQTPHTLHSTEQNSSTHLLTTQFTLNEEMAKEAKKSLGDKAAILNMAQSLFNQDEFAILDGVDGLKNEIKQQLVIMIADHPLQDEERALIEKQNGRILALFAPEPIETSAPCYQLTPPTSMLELKLLHRLMKLELSGQTDEAEMLELYRSYRLNLFTKFKEIQDAIEAAFKTYSNEDWERVRMRVHKLAGSSGTYGFNEASPFLKEWEQVIVLYRDAPDSARSVPNLHQDFLDRLVLAANLFLNGEKPLHSAQMSVTKVLHSSILIIDDDTEFLEALSKEAQRKGFEVETCSNFEQALEKIEKRDCLPHFLLSDMHIGESGQGGGEQILKRFREFHPDSFDTILGLMTSDDTIESRLKAYHGGGNVFFAKPIEASQLIYQVELYCRAETSREAKIVIIDDDVDFCRMVEAALNHTGYYVVSVNEPRDLFATLEKEMPDLLFLDLSFPDVNGLDLLETLHNDYRFRHLHTIVVSATPFNQTINREFIHDIYDYWQKPLEVNALIPNLKRVIKAIMLEEIEEDRDPMLGIYKKSTLSHYFASFQQKYSHIHAVYVECHNISHNQFMKLGLILNKFLGTKEFVGLWDMNEFVILVVDYRSEQLKALLETVFEMIDTDDLLSTPIHEVVALFSIATYPEEGKTLSELVSAAKNRISQTPDVPSWKILAAPAELVAPQDKNILLMSSNVSLLETINYSLRLRNYSTICFEEGLKAFDYIKHNFTTQLPNLIILDGELEDESPSVILSKMRYFIGQSVPIFFLSHLSKEEDVHEGSQLGATDLILKPFSMNILMQRVDQEMIK